MRRYASTGTSYGPLSVSVHLYLSQVGVLSKRLDGSSWFLAWRLLLTSPTLRYKKNQASTKIRVIPPALFPKLRTLKFCHSILTVETCHQLSSKNVDAQSVINWVVVSQLN